MRMLVRGLYFLGYQWVHITSVSIASSGSLEDYNLGLPPTAGGSNDPRNMTPGGYGCTILIAPQLHFQSENCAPIIRSLGRNYRYIPLSRAMIMIYLREWSLRRYEALSD
jgi:hypothetical protein